MSQDEIADLRERMARVETKLDIVLASKVRWASIGPAIVSAVTSGAVLLVFKLLAT